jgi:hypothetical protein
MINDSKYIYTETSEDKTKYRYGKSEILTQDTYLRNKIDADSLSGKILWLLKDISPIIDISLKVSQIEKNMGDRLRITMARTPYSIAGGYNEREFEIIGKELSCYPVVQGLTLRDLMEFGGYVGIWMGASVPNWITATPNERLTSGFWADEDGYIDPPNDISLNKSLWW